MSLGRILFTDGGTLADLVGARLEQLNPGYEFVPVKDGARLVSVFARLAKMRRPPVVTVLVPPLKRVDAAASMACLRALERAVGWRPSPILYVGKDDEVSQALLKATGLAALVSRDDEAPEAEQVEQLSQSLSAWLTELRAS